MLTNATGLPDGYDGLFEHYFDFMKSIVARSGINPQDVEDVASEILVKFIERDALSWYDPTLLHDTGENPRIPGERYRPAKFQALLRSFTSKYVLQHRDKQFTKMRREPIRCEQPVPDGDDEVTWLEARGEANAVTMTSQADFWEVVGQAHEVLSAQPVHGKRDLARAFRVAVRLQTLDGAVDRKKMAAEFECSDSVICTIFREMRDALREAGFGPDSDVWDFAGKAPALLA